MNKRVLSLLLVVAMLASLVVFPVSATGTDVCPCCDVKLTEINWKAWTYPIDVKEGQHYRLEEDLIVPTTIAFGTSKNNNNFTLDLNGHTLRAESGHLFNIGSATAVTVDIIDSVGGGELQAYGTNNSIGVLQILNGSTLNLHSGTIRQLYSPSVVPQYGAIYVMHSNFNMHGGKITDGYTTSTADASAGNVMVRGNSVFKMTGGEIVNGYSVKYGGGVLIYSKDSQFIMEGGKIHNNVSEGNGGNVHVLGSATFKRNAEVYNGVAGGFGGNIYFGGSGQNVILDNVAKIDGDMYLGRTVKLVGTVNIPMGNSNGIILPKDAVNLDLTEMSTDSVIFFGVNWGATNWYGGTSVFTAEGTDAYLNCFKQVGRTVSVAVEGTALKAATITGATDSGKKSYCPHCGETAEPVDWYRLSGSEGGLNSGYTHFFANGSYTLKTTAANQVAVLDIHGSTFTRGSTIFNIAHTGANVAILDSIGGSKITANYTGTGGAIFASLNTAYDTTATMYSGNYIASAPRGGAVAIYKGTFNMKGGIIKDSKCTNNNANGGAIWAGNGADATVNISGGLISNCQNPNGSSGTVALGQGTFKMTGGIIQNGTTKNNAGNITLSGTGAHEISNAIIRGGSQTAASQNGANIQLNKATTLTINNSTICNGTATGNGGNIAVTAGATVNATNSAIYGGSAVNGGNIYASAGNFTFDDTDIQDGIASNDGGNIYVEKVSLFNITDSMVNGGEATNSAGNMYIRGNCTFAAANMTNTSILNGTSGDPEVDTAVRTDNIFTGKSLVLDNVKVSGCSGLDSIGSGITAVNNVNANPISVTLKNNTVIGVENDPFSASLYVQQGANAAATGSVVVDSSFSGLAVLSPYYQLDDDGKTSPYGEILLNVSYSGNPTGKLYLGNHKTTASVDDATGEVTKPSEIWAYGMPEIFKVADGQLQVAGGLLESKNGKQFFATTQDAVDACTTGKVVKLLAENNDLTLADGKTYYIDMNGKMANVYGEGIVYGIDTTNTTAADATAGELTPVDAEVVVMKSAISPVDGKQYVNVPVADMATFHNIEMDITKVTLRTSSAGVFYKGQWTCDSVLEKYIQDNGLEYGVVVSLTDMPEADFVTENTADATPNLYSVWGGAGFVSGAEQTGVAVSNILLATMNPENERTAEQNAAYCAMPIFAKAYLNLGDGEYIVGGAGAKLSMMDVLKKIDEALVANADFTTEGNTAAATLMETFYNNFKNEGLADAIAEYGYEFQAIFQEA